MVDDIDLWLRYPKVSSTARTFNEAIAPFGAICDQLDKALNDLESTKRPKLFLVVDTSAIIDCPDATRMLASLGLSGATLVVPSTTIIELEDLKSSRRDDAFRRKLTAAIRYLNETMDKGDPLKGVVLSKDISLRMLADEPDFLRLPTWLDSTIPDDRILGAAIEIQRDNPLSDVMLVANDISMQNKAMLAKMQVKKVPNLSEEAA